MGGAMQLTFRKMAFDYYPFHWAGRRILNGGMVLAWLRYLEQIPGFTPDAQQEGVRDCSTRGIGNSPLQEDISGIFQVHY